MSLNLRCLLCPPVLLAFVITTLRAADPPAHREWTIDGVVREALVYTPSSAKISPAPLVFAFHGHGGTMRNASRVFDIHTRWPEAIAVYMQGLDTPGRLTDPEGKRPGWQSDAGAEGDRDLKFFDAALGTLKQELKVDAKRVYVTGHSNGGGFTYTLWAYRGEALAAVAPCCAVATPQQGPALKPKPVFHVAGQKDPLVRFTWQQHTMETLRKLNECSEGQPWGNATGCTLYPSKIQAPVVTFIYPGGHALPSEAPDLIVKFFKEHAKP